MMNARVLIPNKPFTGVLKSKKSPLNFEGIMQVLSDTKVRELKMLWK